MYFGPFIYTNLKEDMFRKQNSQKSHNKQTDEQMFSPL